jgi:hypothetical protein
MRAGSLLGTVARSPTSLGIAHVRGTLMLKVLAWVVGILLLIGLLVVVGVFDLIL